MSIPDADEMREGSEVDSSACDSGGGVTELAEGSAAEELVRFGSGQDDDVAFFGDAVEAISGADGRGIVGAADALLPDDLSGGGAEAGDGPGVGEGEEEVVFAQGGRDIGGVGEHLPGDFGLIAIGRGAQGDEGLAVGTFAAVSDDEVAGDDWRRDDAEGEGIGGLPEELAAGGVDGGEPFHSTGEDELGRVTWGMEDAGSGRRHAPGLSGSLPSNLSREAVEREDGAFRAFLVVGDNDRIVEDDRGGSAAMLAGVSSEVGAPGVGAVVVERDEGIFVRSGPDYVDVTVVDRRSGSGVAVVGVLAVRAGWELADPEALAGVGIKADDESGGVIAVAGGEEEAVVPDNGRRVTGAGKLRGPPVIFLCKGDRDVDRIGQAGCVGAAEAGPVL